MHVVCTKNTINTTHLEDVYFPRSEINIAPTPSASRRRPACLSLSLPPPTTTPPSRCWRARSLDPLRARDHGTPDLDHRLVPPPLPTLPNACPTRASIFLPGVSSPLLATSSSAPSLLQPPPPSRSESHCRKAKAARSIRHARGNPTDHPPPPLASSLAARSPAPHKPFNSVALEVSYLPLHVSNPGARNGENTCQRGCNNSSTVRIHTVRCDSSGERYAPCGLSFGGRTRSPWPVGLAATC